MNLGIDFDGVITNPLDLKVEWIRANCGLELQPEQTAKHIATGIIGKERYRAMVDEVYFGPLSRKVPLRPDAKAILNSFSRGKHRAYVITSRTDEAVVFAKDLMEHHGLLYHGIFPTGEKPKDKVCRELGVQVFLDDSQHKLRELGTVPGLIRVLFNIYGERAERGILSVSSWEEFHDLVGVLEDFRQHNTSESGK